MLAMAAVLRLQHGGVDGPVLPQLAAALPGERLRAVVVVGVRAASVVVRLHLQQEMNIIRRTPFVLQFVYI